jgi:hypothetical protein
MIKARDDQSACACLPLRCDMGLRIDQVASRIVGEIVCGDCFDDVIRRADEEAAALARPLSERVTNDAIDHRRRDPYDQSASTTIAMPMPPPMHNDAIPYRSFRARSA